MFITFEGIDGSGKSTQAKLFAECLKEKHGRNVILTREPGGWNGGAVLRDMVISGALKHSWSEAYLFMLDRAEHVARVIQPALDSGIDVVCERYHDSTLAYQVWGRGLPLEVFDKLATLSAFPVPDVTLFFDIPADVALKRAAKRGNLDAFENEGIKFMNKIREGYTALAKREPKRWIKLDCDSRGIEEIFKNILESFAARGFFNDR